MLSIILGILRIIRILSYMTVMLLIIILLSAHFLGEVKSYLVKLPNMTIGEEVNLQCQITSLSN